MEMTDDRVKGRDDGCVRVHDGGAARVRRRDEAPCACSFVHRPDPGQVPCLDPMVVRVVPGHGAEGHLVEVDLPGLDADDITSKNSW
jgi:hypothetical protein